MELEARSAAPTSAARGRALTAKVASYRADAAALAKRAKEAAAASSNNARDLARAELGLGGDGGGAATSSSFGGGGGGRGLAGAGGGSSSNDRDRVLAAGERIERSGERIAQGRAQLLQTEVRLFWCRVWRESKERGKQKKAFALANEVFFFQKTPKTQKALGASILESLAAQRGAIERSRERLAETDGALAAGGRALKRMGAWFPWLGRQD